ncbi:MAG: hypothetical protein M3Z95_06405 [Actinomycetota bacterium]|nr:hypothetical protein [Actinomycetota bacterium]
MLRTYQHFTDRDPLSRTVPERMLPGVSTRRYGRTQEPVGEELERAARVQPQTDRHPPPRIVIDRGARRPPTRRRSSSAHSTTSARTTTPPAES